MRVLNSKYSPILMYLINGYSRRIKPTKASKDDNGASTTFVVRSVLTSEKMMRKPPKTEVSTWMTMSIKGGRFESCFSIGFWFISNSLQVEPINVYVSEGDIIGSSD